MSGLPSNHFYMKIILILLLAGALVGCTFRSVSHDPSTAAMAANVFLKALYIEHDYDRALMLSDESLRRMVTSDKLAELVKVVDDNCGELKQLQADSYAKGQDLTLELFYTATCEKKTLYHRLVMVGDVSKGYRTAGVWFQDAPYPGNRPKFKNGIVVQ
jgi:hypothetical protein